MSSTHSWDRGCAIRRYSEGVTNPDAAPATPSEGKEESLPIEPAEAAASNPVSKQVAQTLLLAMLFAAPALMCVHAAFVSDMDLWWHLRAGEWILEHHAVPRTDPFSGTMGGRPWMAYSWLFELLAAKLFAWMGLAGIVAYTSAMILAITVAMFHLVRRLQGLFARAILLSFACVFCMAHLYTPRPWLFTILFFTLETDILMQARKTGRLRELLWLPVIFALWANLHIEFVDGLFVLGLAWAETLAARFGLGDKTRAQPNWMGLALAGSLLATLANPYGWRIYQAAYELATQAGALDKVIELQAIPFRNAADFLVLLLAMGSAAALAWRRRFLLFEMALLGFATALAFRSQRDVWLMAVAGAAILASTIAGNETAAIRLPKLGTGLAVLMAVLAVAMGFSRMQVNNARLESDLAKRLPVQTVEVVKSRGYAGPLFNDFNWGGYLIWSLRMPVSIDGRQNLYGDQRLDRSIATWSAQPDWESDAQLTKAGLVIAPVKAPLTQALRMDPHFHLAYEDELAAVFVARK